MPPLSLDSWTNWSPEVARRRFLQLRNSVAPSGRDAGKIVGLEVTTSGPWEGGNRTRITSSFIRSSMISPVGSDESAADDEMSSLTASGSAFKSAASGRRLSRIFRTAGSLAVSAEVRQRRVVKSSRSSSARLRARYGSHVVFSLTAVAAKHAENRILWPRSSAERSPKSSHPDDQPSHSLMFFE